MVEETKRIIEIEAKYESLADLQAEVTKAKAALDEMMKGQIKALQETKGYQEADLATKRSLTKAIQEQTKASVDYQSGLTAVKALTTEYNAQMSMSAKEYTNIDDGIKVVKGSYNDLLNQLARLKVQWKQAVPGTDAYEQITREVNRVKDTLSGMDAEIGNFQRNVGNYGMKASSSLGLAYTAMRRGATATDSLAGATRAASTAFKAFSTGNPVVGMLTILMPLITKINEGLHSNSTALGAVEKLMKALEPIGNAVANVVEKLAGWISKAVDFFVRLAGQSSGTFKNIISGAVGVGNVLLQYLLTPIRTAIDAFKGFGQLVKDVFTGDFKRIGADAKAAAANIGENFKQGFSLKANFEAGKEIGEKLIDGLTAPVNKQKAEEAGKEIGESFSVKMANEVNRAMAELEKQLDAEWKAMEKAEENANKVANNLANAELKTIDKVAKRQLENNAILTRNEEERAENAYQIQLDANQKKLDALKQFAQDALNRGDINANIEYEQQAADLEVEIAQNAMEEEIRIHELKIKKQKELDEKRKKDTITLANSLASILDSVAGAYQNEIKAQVDAGRISEAEGEKQFQNVKALQIAVSTIQMLTGITTALSGTFTTHTGVWDIALAAAQAASIAASGIANISKIKNTTLGNTQTSSATGAGVQSIQTVAPAVQVAVPEYRTLTSASDEQTLNERAASQKVVLVTSELEAHNAGRKVTLQESTF